VIVSGKNFLSLFAEMKFYYALFLVALVMTSAFYIAAARPAAADGVSSFCLFLLNLYSQPLSAWKQNKIRFWPNPKTVVCANLN